VERVSAIYNGCMNGELAKGTAITHKSRYGIDPARLLRGDDGPDETQKETLELLKEHVANRLYFMTTTEWMIGVDAVNAKRAKDSKAFWRGVSKKLQSFGKNLLMIAVLIAIRVIELALTVSQMVLSKVKGGVGNAASIGASAAKAAGGTGAAGGGGGDEEEGADGGIKLDVGVLDGSQLTKKLKAFREKYFNVDAAMAGALDALADEDEGTAGETLDDQHAEPDDDALPKKGAAPGAGANATRDDFFSSLTIDAYMKFRTKTVLAYFERTSPWRGFWMQLAEITIFIMNACGAVLVGLGTDFVPFVAMTVSAAAIARSFLEFSRLGKQVEAYNIGINMIHGMMNKWDRMTRTQRRTISTVAEVVGTVESALDIVCLALTDAMPGAGGDDEEEGEGEKEE